MSELNPTLTEEETVAIEVPTEDESTDKVDTDEVPTDDDESDDDGQIQLIEYTPLVEATIFTIIEAVAKVADDYDGDDTVIDAAIQAGLVIFQHTLEIDRED